MGAPHGEDRHPRIHDLVRYQIVGPSKLASSSLDVSQHWRSVAPDMTTDLEERDADNVARVCQGLGCTIGSSVLSEMLITRIPEKGLDSQPQFSVGTT
jgi:hypothetical protein